MINAGAISEVFVIAPEHLAVFFILEALVLAEEGLVTATARRAFEEALALDPRHATALFYRALADREDGTWQVVRNGVAILMEVGGEKAVRASSWRCTSASVGSKPSPWSKPNEDTRTYRAVQWSRPKVMPAPSWPKKARASRAAPATTRRTSRAGSSP